MSEMLLLAHVEKGRVKQLSGVRLGSSPGLTQLKVVVVRRGALEVFVIRRRACLEVVKVRGRGAA
jgi:hypothetical protein